MQFSLSTMNSIEDHRLAAEAEALGYDAVWFADNPMLRSDCYAVMALAAQVTTRIRLGTGVAVPGTRIAPATANAIASVHQLAPGRVFLGIGVGGAAARMLGRNPMPLREFGDYLGVLRSLLGGAEADDTSEAAAGSIRFLNEGRGFRNAAERIPIYGAANGPKALQLAGRYGDGLVSASGVDADTITARLGLVERGARAAGREIGPDFHTTAVANVVVLRPGETLQDDRVIDATGAIVTALLHWAYGLYQKTRDEERVPDFMRGVWEEYRDYVESLETPPSQRFQQIMEGNGTHCRPEERRFVTPALIEACSLAAGPDEIAERLRKAESAGLSELSLTAPLAAQRELMRDFSEVMKRL